MDIATPRIRGCRLKPGRRIREEATGEYEKAARIAPDGLLFDGLEKDQASACSSSSDGRTSADAPGSAFGS